MARTLYEPIAAVSRCITPTLVRSPTALRSPSKQAHHMAASSSKVGSVSIPVISKSHAALKPDSDDDFEVLGPFPVQTSSFNNGTKHQLNETKESNVINPLVSTSLHKRHVFPAQTLRPMSNSGASAQSAAKFSTSCSGSTSVSVTSIETSISVPDITGLTISSASKVVAARRRRAKALEESNIDLPVYSYRDYTDPKPHVVYTTDESEANDLVGALKPGPVAFDMEWHYFTTRTRGGPHKLVERRTAVVQIADSAGLILVLQVHRMNRFPKRLQTLIEDPSVAKLGVNILNDGKKLFRDYGILAKNLVELGAVAMVADPSFNNKRKIVSLAKLTARYCNKLLRKGEERSSNWELPLDRQQLDYAANDVHSAVMIHSRLLAIAQEQSVELPSLTAFSVDVEPYFDSAAISRTSSTSSVESGQSVVDVEMRPQFMRAYRYWHDDGMSMNEMCVKLSLKGMGSVSGAIGEGLKVGTVITYIVSALQANPKLPFEMVKLRDLVQMDGTSWMRHRSWILTAWSEGLGVQPAENGTNHETDSV